MDEAISKQSAIDALRRLYIENPQIDNDFVYDMALDQADDAIKQLPPIQPELGTNLAEVGTDCISRQQAIKALSTITMYKDSIPYNTAVMRIEQLPPAEPKRETTTLRIGRTRNSVTMWYECAECGEPVDHEDAFCRRCGREIIHE